MSGARTCFLRNGSPSGALELGCQTPGRRNAAGKETIPPARLVPRIRRLPRVFPGDDVRRFDWGVYSRTGKAFVRQFMDEQELTVSLLVDCSASMGAVMSSPTEPSTADPEGTKGSPKWLLARQLAASIGYMALSSYDRLQVACYSRSINARLPIMRGKGSAHRLFSFLQGAETGGEGSLGAALAVPGALPRQPGMTWVFSDFWLEGGEEELFRSLSLFVRYRTGSGAGACIVAGGAGA